MKKAIYITITFILFTTAFCVSASAEAGKGAFAPDERFLAAWNVNFEIPADTVIDEKLAGYDLLNMPAIKAGAAFIHENPPEDGEWEWNIEDYGGYLLFCEENGDVIHVCLYKDRDGNDTLELMYKYEHGKYPDWLSIALGHVGNEALPDDEEILKIIVTDPCTYPYHIQNERYVCFDTTGGKYLCAVDITKLYCGYDATRDTFDSYIVTVSENEYRAVVKDYLKHYEKWEKNLEPEIGGALYPSFFAAYMCGNPPEIESAPIALYVVLALTAAVTAVVITVVIVKAVKKRSATLNCASTTKTE